MATKLVLGQSVVLHVSGTDAASRTLPPTALPTVPAWTTSDATKVSITPSPDGTDCVVKGIGVGNGVTVTATIAGPITSVTTFDVVSGAVTALVTEITQGPGDIDDRQKSANGRYLGLGFAGVQNE